MGRELPKIGDERITLQRSVKGELWVHEEVFVGSQSANAYWDQASLDFVYVKGRWVTDRFHGPFVDQAEAARFVRAERLAASGGESA